jgi:ABC-type bacteriocin/lantibiotic exporter with double-glycine peptidase domain
VNNFLKGILKFIFASIIGGFIAAAILLIIAVILFMTNTEFTWKALGQVWIGASLGIGGLIERNLD